MGFVNNPIINNGSGGGGNTGDIPNANTGTAGIVKLSNSIESSSQTVAATPLAVKSALQSANTYTDAKFADLPIVSGLTPPSNRNKLWFDEN